MENVNVGKNLLEHMSINVGFNVQVLNELVHNILLQYTQNQPAVTPSLYSLFYA